MPRASLLVGEGVAPVLVDEVGVACTPVLTDVAEVLAAPISVLPLAIPLALVAVLAAPSWMLVETPPVGDAGAEAFWT
jgi:hypothetical protein